MCTMCTMYTDQNAMFPFKPEIKGFVWSGWLFCLLSRFTFEQVGEAVKMVSSIKSILTPVPLLSPSRSLGGGHQTPQNTSQTSQRIPPPPQSPISHISDNSLRYGRPSPKRLLLCCKKYLILGRSTISSRSYLDLFSI